MDARDDEDGWFSSGADAAHTVWLEEMAHVKEEPTPEQAGPGWLIVDAEAPGGVRELTRAEQEHCSQLVAATAPNPSEPAQDEPDEDEPE